VGELVRRGPTARSGYIEDEEATRSAFDEEGYFHTGDRARIDEEGYFFIVDRLKDMFISGGENVYPAEIEQALYEHADISMCAVIGVPSEKWGEVGCAFVVLREGKRLKEKDVIGFLKKRLASYKVPKQVIFMNSLPISGAGKVQKTELRKTAAELQKKT
ncbi:MAG: long-chain fatty acid--CoA ligase, partial [Anaerolineae bacterium]